MLIPLQDRGIETAADAGEGAGSPKATRTALREVATLGALRSATAELPDATPLYVLMPTGETEWAPAWFEWVPVDALPGELRGLAEGPALVLFEGPLGEVELLSTDPMQAPLPSPDDCPACGSVRIPTQASALACLVCGP